MRKITSLHGGTLCLTLDRLGFMCGISFQSDFICCILRITTTTLSDISSTQPGKEFWGPTSYSACRDASLQISCMHSENGQDPMTHQTSKCASCELGSGFSVWS